MRKTLIRVLPLLFLAAALLSSCYNPFFDSILGRRRGRNRDSAGAQPLAALGVVTDLAAVRDSPVTFTWTDPEGDFEYIEIWYGYSDSDKAGTSLTPIRVPKGTQTCTIDDPLPGEELYFHFITVDANGKRSAVVNYLVPLTVPVQLTNLTGKVTGLNSITLSWTNPAGPAFDHIEITINPGGTTRKPLKGAETYAWNGLSPGAEYTFTVKTFDKDGKITTAEVTVTLAADTMPPLPVTNLSAVNNDFGSVPLKWKNPPDADLQYVEITCEPSAGKAQKVNAVPSADGSYTWNGLAGGLTYTFTLKAVDHSGNRSAEASVSGAPLDTTPPAAVTNLKAVPGEDGCAVLTWKDPGDTDLDYIQIECNEIAGPAKNVYPGTGTYTWYGLSNGASYTFTVTTRDLTGNLGAAASVAFFGPNAGGGAMAIKTINGTAYEIHTFTYTGTGSQATYALTFYSGAKRPAAVDFLVVAGGGAGGSLWWAGGGGGGAGGPAVSVRTNADIDGRFRAGNGREGRQWGQRK